MTALLLLGLTTACHAPDAPGVEEPVPASPPRTVSRPEPGCLPRPPEGPDDWSADADGDCFDVYADCDDNDPDRNPSAPEWCDGLDNDCDGVVDHDESWQRDGDGDGFGAGEVLWGCSGYGEGYIDYGVDFPVDCDDSDPSVWPGAIDVPGDRIDQDCTGADACGAICIDEYDPNDPYDTDNCLRSTEGGGIVAWAEEYCDDFQEYPSLILLPLDSETSLAAVDCVCAVGELGLYGQTGFSLEGVASMGVYTALRSNTFRGFDAGSDLRFAIESSSAASMEGLEYVRTVPALRLGFYDDSYNFEYDENAELTSLGGLSSLEEVTGELYLYGLVSMTDLQGLEHLSRVGELRIYDTGLVNLRGLDGLETAGSIHIDGWPAMQSLDGLQGLVSIEGDFYLQDYDTMSLSGLDNLVSVGGNLRLYAPIGSLAGTESLRSVGGSLSLSSTGVSDLGPLAALREVGSLGLHDEAIASLEPLLDLEYVGGLSLDGLPLNSLAPLRGALTSTLSGIGLTDLALSTLDGLENVTAVNGDVVLVGLPITDLTGLDSLEEVRSLVIRNNPNLFSLHGLDRLRSVTSTIDIVDNPLLPEDEVMDLLNRIGRENIGGKVTIGESD